MIYFIQEGSNVIGCGGHIKIGYSASPRNRLRQIGYGCPSDLHLVGISPGCVKQEKELHQRFAEYRVGNSEWFEPGPWLTLYLGSGLPEWDYRNPDLHCLPVSGDWIDSEIAAAREMMAEDPGLFR